MITSTVSLLKAVFSREFSSFILCTDPLILKHTKSKAKHPLLFPFGWNVNTSHWEGVDSSLWQKLHLCTQLFVFVPLSHSQWHTVSLILHCTSTALMRWMCWQPLTRSLSPVAGRRRQAHTSHKWLWLQNFPSPAWTASTGWHLRSYDKTINIHFIFVDICLAEQHYSICNYPRQS